MCCTIDEFTACLGGTGAVYLILVRRRPEGGGIVGLSMGRDCKIVEQFPGPREYWVVRWIEVC